MNSTMAAITPRSRRYSGHRAESTPTPVEDPRTRVLIRVPWVKASHETKAKTASIQSVESPSSKTTVQHLGSLGSTAIPSAQFRSAPQTTASQSFARIDAAHSVVPAPHMVAPAWLDRSKSWPIKLIQKPSTWITALFAVVMVLVLFRNGNQVTPPIAPAANSVKREPKKASERKPVDSAAVDKHVHEDRIARSPSTDAALGKPYGSTGPALASPSQSVAPNYSANFSDQPGLNRRAASNAPGALNEIQDWSSNPQVIQSSGTPNPISNSNGFQFNETPSHALPPIDAAPAVDQSHENSDSSSRAAWLPGTIQSLPYR